jgi:ATP-binding cassette, subfamily B, bacterial
VPVPRVKDAFCSGAICFGLATGLPDKWLTDAFAGMSTNSQKIRIARLLAPHWKALTVGVLAAVASAGLDLLQPWPLKIVIDYVVGTKAMPAWLPPDKFLILNLAALSLIGIALIGAIASYIENVLMTTVGQWITHDLRTTLYDHVQRLSLTYHDNNRTGDLVSRVTSDIDTIQGFITSTLLSAFIDVVTLVGMIVIMASIDVKFTFVALAIAPLLFAFIYKYTHAIKTVTRAVRKKESDIVSNIHEVFSSIRVVKAFASEKYEKERFERESMESVELTLRAKALKAGLSPAVDVIVAAGSAVVLWYGARLVLQGTLTPGSLIVFLVYLGKLYSPIRGLSKLPDTFSKPAIAFERIQEVMDVEVKDPERQKSQKAAPFTGLIEFDNVSFGYRPDRPILQDINFRIEPGQIAAFVGPTGAGKTTIVSLIPRFYEPTSGIIRIDGVDVQTLKRRSLRKQLGFVLQDTILFRTSVFQNIAYGRPTAAHDEIVEAARQANAHDFIMEMPEGYETLIGERGVTLSGGQRQRIGIARAIVRNAPILILDEPTSGLDSASEAIVFDALERLMAGRTCIVISHRLPTIRHADVIFVLSDGRIVERGGHPKLMESGGLYSELYATHFQ